MRIVIALGGNALLRRTEPLEEQIQRKNVAQACRVIAQVAGEHEVIITHGNGPQVGLLALQNDAYKAVSPYHLDVLGAETEGMIGYMLSQELKNCIPKKNVVAMLTQTLVNSDDPAFKHPTKFVGPVYTKEQAEELVQQKGWVVKADGDYFRRVVPSPQPQRIIEVPIINYLLKMEDLIIICAGGGGVPVTFDKNKKLKGLEAVVDKDQTSNVLALAIKADALIMLTDVAGVETHFGMPNSKKIKEATPEQLKAYAFAKGSMGPKVRSAISFVKSGGKFSAIGALDDLVKIIPGELGTRIVSNSERILFYKETS